jgi:pSer/pThr/pTyr-binding forkhead associated (FHA) protein
MAATQRIDWGLSTSLDENDEQEDRGPVYAQIRYNKEIHSLFLGENLIGKNKEKCDVKISHTSVSDTHCEITINELASSGGCRGVCKDMRSTNGTYIEKESGSKEFVKLKKGQKMELKDGINIRLGLVNLVFEYVPLVKGSGAAKKKQQPEDHDEYDIPSSPEPKVVTDETTQYMPDDDEFLEEDEEEEGQSPAKTPSGSAIGNKSSLLKKKQLSTVKEASAECDPYDITDDDEGEIKASAVAAVVEEEEPTQLLPDDDVEDEIAITEIPTEEDEPNPVPAPVVLVDEEATEEEEDEPLNASTLDGSATEGEEEADPVTAAAPQSSNQFLPPTYSHVMALQASDAIVIDSFSRPLTLPRSDTLSSDESEEMTHDQRPILVDEEAIKLMLPTNMFGSPSPAPATGAGAGALSSVTPSAAPSPISSPVRNQSGTGTLRETESSSSSITSLQQKNEEISVFLERNQASLADAADAAPVVVVSPEKSPRSSGVGAFASGLKRFIIADDTDEEEERVTLPAQQQQGEDMDTQEQQCCSPPMEPPILSRDIPTDPQQLAEEILPPPSSSAAAATPLLSSNKRLREEEKEEEDKKKEEEEQEHVPETKRGRVTRQATTPADVPVVVAPDVTVAAEPEETHEQQEAPAAVRSSVRRGRGKKTEDPITPATSESKPEETVAPAPKRGRAKRGEAASGAVAPPPPVVPEMEAEKEKEKELVDDSASEASVQTRGKRKASAAPAPRAKRGKAAVVVSEEPKEELQSDPVADHVASSVCPPLAVAPPVAADVSDDPSSTAPKGRGGRKRSAVSVAITTEQTMASEPVVVASALSTKMTTRRRGSVAVTTQEDQIEEKEGKEEKEKESEPEQQEQQHEEKEETDLHPPPPPSPVVSVSSQKNRKRTSTSASRRGSSSAAATEPSSSGTGNGDRGGEQVCILLTGYQRDARIEKLVHDIGAVITNEPSPEVTHCLTTPALKRTPKLLMSINYGVKFILTLDWLEDSARIKKPIPLSLALPQAQSLGDEEEAGEGAGTEEGGALGAVVRRNTKKYLIQDAQKEALWEFSLWTTLQRSNPQLWLTSPSLSTSSSSPAAAAAAASGGAAAGGGGDGILGRQPLFENLSVFVTKGVCGNGAPKEIEMKGIVTSGGGVWLPKLPTAAKGKAAKGAGTAGEAGAGAGKVIVISSESVASKEVTKAVLEFAKGGGGHGIYSVEFLFLAILRYQVDLDTGLLQDYRF